MRYLFTISVFSIILFFISCSPEKTNENLNNPDVEFQFEIVDSLVIDYLGVPLLCDFSPNQEYILLYNSRNTEFIIANKKGEIINQFEKSGDIPDNPGTLADRPIFYDNETLIGHGQKGVWAYNFEGENVWKIEREEPISYWFSKTYGRSMYMLEPKHIFSVINYDQLSLNASNDSLYKNHHVLKIVNRKTGLTEPALPLEPFSRFLDGKGYKPAKMLPSNHVKGNQMVVSYSKEELVYLYEWVDHSFQLTDTFSLNITPFYLDEAKERDSFNEQNAFTFDEKIGEADVRGSWLLSDGKVLIQYNRGLKESKRKKAKMEKTGENSIRLVSPDNIPIDQFQVYRNGIKYGRPINPSMALSSLLYLDGEFIWFKKNNEALGVEDDYAVFYKTKLIQKD